MSGVPIRERRLVGSVRARVRFVSSARAGRFERVRGSLRAVACGSRAVRFERARGSVDESEPDHAPYAEPVLQCPNSVPGALRKHAEIVVYLSGEYG